jgi:hypothetical protein
MPAAAGCNANRPHTKARSAQANAIRERFHKCLLQDFYQVALCKKTYHTLDELQADLDTWLQQYNELRPHTGQYCFGKTPMQTFLDSLPLAKERLLDQTIRTTADVARLSDQVLATAPEEPRELHE